MNRNQRSILAGVLVLATGLGLPDSPSTADPAPQIGQLQAKSTQIAQAPLLGRIVIRPSLEQLAKLRAEQRLGRNEPRDAAALSAADAQIEPTGAL